MPGMADSIIAAIAGSIDYGNAHEFRRGLMRLLEAQRPRGMVLEMSGIENLDTAAAAVLVELLMEGRRRGSHVYLCQPSQSVRDLFRLSGLVDALECCCDSPAEVERKLQEQAKA
jgi:anti-anti-sigma factor